MDAPTTSTEGLVPLLSGRPMRSHTRPHEASPRVKFADYGRAELTRGGADWREVLLIELPIVKGNKSVGEENFAPKRGRARGCFLLAPAVADDWNPWTMVRTGAVELWCWEKA